jgi:hypothetical protein
MLAAPVDFDPAASYGQVQLMLAFVPLDFTEALGQPHLHVQLPSNRPFSSSRDMLRAYDVLRC